MTKKLKPKKPIPKSTIEFDKAYWDKLSKQGCQDGACELKPK